MKQNLRKHSLSFEINEQQWLMEIIGESVDAGDSAAKVY
jgi:hypothetical protein